MDPGAHFLLRIGRWHSHRDTHRGVFVTVYDWILFVVCWSLPAVLWLARLYWDWRISRG